LVNDEYVSILVFDYLYNLRTIIVIRLRNNLAFLQ